MSMISDDGVFGIETDEDRLREVDDRLLMIYDDVFLPDGSLLEPLSILDDPADLA